MTAPSAAVAVHLVFTYGQADQWLRALIVGAGTMAGAQLGVLLAARVSGRFVLRVIAVGLVIAGARQLVSALG